VGWQDKSVSDSGLTIETAMHGRTDAASAPQVAITHAARQVYPDKWDQQGRRRRVLRRGGAVDAAGAGGPAAVAAARKALRRAASLKRGPWDGIGTLQQSLPKL